MLAAEPGEQPHGGCGREPVEPRALGEEGPELPDKVNEMWGTDMTQTITVEEGRACVFVAVEHANSEVVGIHAARWPIASRSRCARGCIGASNPSHLVWRVD